MRQARQEAVVWVPENLAAPVPENLAAPPMRPPDDPEVAAWLAKAHVDLRMCDLATGADTPI